MLLWHGYNLIPIPTTSYNYRSLASLAQLCSSCLSHSVLINDNRMIQDIQGSVKQFCASNIFKMSCLVTWTRWTKWAKQGWKSASTLDIKCWKLKQMELAATLQKPTPLKKRPPHAACDGCIVITYCNVIWSMWHNMLTRMPSSGLAAWKPSSPNLGFRHLL